MTAAPTSEREESLRLAAMVCGFMIALLSFGALIPAIIESRWVLAAAVLGPLAIPGRDLRAVAGTAAVNLALVAAAWLAGSAHIAILLGARTLVGGAVLALGMILRSDPLEHRRNRLRQAAWLALSAAAIVGAAVGIARGEEVALGVLLVLANVAARWLDQRALQ